MDSTKDVTDTSEDAAAAVTDAQSMKRPGETDEGQDIDAKLSSNIQSITLAESTERNEYTLVDEESQIKPALDELLKQDTNPDGPSLAVKCKAGESLNRKGTLSLVTVGTKDHVYLFDIQKLGSKVFDLGLRDLLEDADREKLMFDCRGDSDCLWHLFKVKLTNVLDLQLLQVIYRQDHPEDPRYGYVPKGYQPKLNGFSKSMRQYVNNGDFRIKDPGYALLNDGKTIMKRPIDEKLMKYAAADILGCFPLYEKLKGALNLSSDTANLKRGSQKYLEIFRSKDERDYSEYELNPFLPWGVLDLPKFKHVNIYQEQKTCAGCKRRFAISHFHGDPKCPVCKTVDRGF